MVSRALIVGALLVLGGCGAGFPAPRAAVAPAPTDVERGAGWDLYAFDVGTGLSIFLRGPDFSLLYDGGSNDDRATGASNRVLAYLTEVVGPSGGSGCRYGDAKEYPRRSISHLVLSHPHRDHVSLLGDVLRCYDVENAWDSGNTVKTAEYARFIAAVAASEGTRLHSARPAPSESIPSQRRVIFHEGERIELGREASARVLYVDSAARDPNDASIVLRIDLGPASVLLTGDLTAGDRASPSSPPRPGSGEGKLLASRRAELDVDILQVGHHGSLTSSRAAFLDAVSPAWSIISSGPTRYGKVVLPDEGVVEALRDKGSRVLRTDEDDAACTRAADKIGAPSDGKPGGCSTIVLHIDDRGQITRSPRRALALPTSPPRAEP